jgi:hypothetical protein
MIADDAEAIALYHPPGQHAKRRSGNRSPGPKGPRIMPGDWDAADDLSAWRWKDEDEFSWAREVGLLTPEQALLAEAQARKAIATLEARAWPFDADWSRWTPNLDWPIPLVPDDFHRL